MQTCAKCVQPPRVLKKKNCTDPFRENDGCCDANVIFLYSVVVQHNKPGKLIRELLKDDGRTHLLSCFGSGAVSMVLRTSCPLFPYCYTVGFSTSPLWAPIPPKALPLSIVLVFGVLFEPFAYQIRRLQLSYS